MARKAAVQVDNKFIRGLITEATALSFPEDACTETWNCIFDETGRITRRQGIDYEANFAAVGYSFEDNFAYTDYFWETSRGESLKSFVLQQHGRVISFFDVSDNVAVGANHEVSYITNLLDYTPDIVQFDPGFYECQYATGNNQLIIVNKGIDPILVTYNSDTDSISIEKIKLKYRDFEGLEDNLGLTERVTQNLAGLISTNPNHYYNLLNQGWHVTDALTQWDTARSDMPSNADQVPFFRSSETDAFDAARVTANSSVLNTPAPKGHFILEVGNINRTQAMATEGFSAIVSNESTLISAATGSVISNADANQANAFDSTTSQLASNSAYKSISGSGVNFGLRIGKDFSATPQTVGYVTIYSSSDLFFFDTSSTENINVSLYGKNGSAPVANNDGTRLGSGITVGGSSQYTLASNDTVTEWDYLWVVLSSTSSGGVFYIAEVEFYTPSNTLSYHRPQAVAFYSGRAWYTGIEDGTLNNNIYFSRIILDNEDFSKCYQANDPTSEFNADLLADDGGVVRILEAGRILRLFAYQNSLLVLATNGVWRISGGQNQGFQANDVVIRKISSIAIDAPHSVVDVKGIPLWWGEDGIYTVQYEANYDAFSVVSLTEDTIKSFITDIPRYNRRFVKGAYHMQDEVIYWVYNDTASLVTADRYKYNKILCLNVRSKAFYPWSITGDPKIRGLVYIRDAERTLPPKMKFVTTKDVTSSTANIYYSEFFATDYEDWDTNGTAVIYSSYFTTGYKLHGETQRFGQLNYVFVFLETEANSSCYVQGIYDFTNSGDSNKWGSRQQVYNSALTHRDVNFRRLKIRGKGRAIQLKFSSEINKPFTIIGWSIRETQTGSI